MRDTIFRREKSLFAKKFANEKQVSRKMQK